MLQLRLFGVPRLFDANGRVITFGRGQLGLRLLIFLAFQGEAGAVAQSLYDHVWPLAESDDDGEDTGNGAAEKVRHAMKRVRGVLAPHLPAGREAVAFGASLYRLDPAVIWSDVAAFTACVKEARRQTTDTGALPLLCEALGYCRAPLAQEVPERWFDPVWLDQERAHYQEQARKAALWAAAALARHEDYAGAVALYQQLRALAIVDDEIAQVELICQALRGERALIAQSYEEHVAALARLGMRPWNATRDLCDRLMAGPVTEDLRQRTTDPTRS